jgi:hypothetical protein
MEYKILYMNPPNASTPDLVLLRELEKKVNKVLNDGGSLVGGVFKSQGRSFYQAVMSKPQTTPLLVASRKRKTRKH